MEPLELGVDVDGVAEALRAPGQALTVPTRPGTLSDPSPIAPLVDSTDDERGDPSPITPLEDSTTPEPGPPGLWQ